jgi:Mn2+/Fe2+ NRAMP family transporter
VKQALELFLGILTAMGGFVEIGELTFSVNAGVHFGYSLLWLTVLGTVGIMVFGEMAGRVAAVAHQPVFNLIRERAGFNAGLVTLIAANAVTLLTCAAEIGGVALVLQLLVDLPYRAMIVLTLVLLLGVTWVLPFRWIERVFGLGGLLLCVVLVVAWRESPDWQAVAAGLVPRVPSDAVGREVTLYWYYVVALLSSILLPYEVYFYAAGAIEDKWTRKDVPLNRVVVVVGFALGSLLAVALMSTGAHFFAPRNVELELPGTAVLAAAHEFGKVGMLLMLGGMLFAFAGAALETSLSGAYNLAHFLGWPWGKFRAPAAAPRFTLAWVAIFVLGALVMLSGVDPIKVVEYSIVFSVIILPLSYFPLLVVASDRRVMGEHVNGPIARTLGWIYLALVTVAALAAVPLLVATHGGRG